MCRSKMVCIHIGNIIMDILYLLQAEYRFYLFFFLNFLWEWFATELLNILLIFMLNYYENSGIYYFRPICIKILLIHEFGNEKKN